MGAGGAWSGDEVSWLTRVEIKGVEKTFTLTSGTLISESDFSRARRDSHRTVLAPTGSEASAPSSDVKSATYKIEYTAEIKGATTGTSTKEKGELEVTYREKEDKTIQISQVSVQKGNLLGIELAILTLARDGAPGVAVKGTPLEGERENIIEIVRQLKEAKLVTDDFLKNSLTALEPSKPAGEKDDLTAPPPRP